MSFRFRFLNIPDSKLKLPKTAGYRTARKFQTVQYVLQRVPCPRSWAPATTTTLQIHHVRSSLVTMSLCFPKHHPIESAVKKQLQLQGAVTYQLTLHILFADSFVDHNVRIESIFELGLTTRRITCYVKCRSIVTFAQWRLPHRDFSRFSL